MKTWGEGRRSRPGIAILGATLAVVIVAVLQASASLAAPAATCNLVPQLRAVTVNQGFGYATLARGKDTLVRLFLSLPSCASSGNTIGVTGATLTAKNGSTTLGTINAPIPVPTAPYP